MSSQRAKQSSILNRLHKAGLHPFCKPIMTAAEGARPATKATVKTLVMKPRSSAA